MNIMNGSFTYNYAKTHYGTIVEIKTNNKTGISYLVKRCSQCGCETDHTYRCGDKVFCSMPCALKDAMQTK